MIRPAFVCAGSAALALAACGADPLPPPADPASQDEQRALEKAAQMLDSQPKGGNTPDTAQKEPTR